MEKKKILLVEDEMDLMAALRQRLEESDYDVITASDGAEGFESAKRDRPDLIILDLMLPKMDGYKVCGLLKKDSRYAKTPIIIFSARGQESDIRLGREMGADAYVTKPFDPEALMEQVQKMIHS